MPSLTSDEPGGRTSLQPATMKDVARHAQVSLKTVSRFVNGEGNVNSESALRIASAIEELGYRRNLAAASLRPGRGSMVLGMIVSDLANPYFSMLANQVESMVKSEGYLLLIASSDDDGTTHDRLIERMLEHRVDGLLVVPPRTPGRSWSDQRIPLPPIVALDRPLGEGFDAVLTDNRGGARAATTALLASNPRRIALLSDSLRIYTMRERERGFAEAVAAHPNPVETLVDSAAHTLDQAFQHCVRLLADERVDALFTANNRSATGALMAFNETGRRVPLISFDDFEAATLLNPGVSVIRHDFRSTAQAALATLRRRVAGDTGAAGTTMIETELVLRGSELACPQ